MLQLLEDVKQGTPINRSFDLVGEPTEGRICMRCDRLSCEPLCLRRLSLVYSSVPPLLYRPPYLPAGLLARFPPFVLEPKPRSLCSRLTALLSILWVLP